MDINELSLHIDYNPETGLFNWKINGRGRQFNKKKNSYKERNGYISIKINKKYFRAHQLAWILYYKQIPPKGMYIDHINGIKTDNRICNLRLCTSAESAWNRKKPKTNKTGYKGISVNKKTGKFYARIGVNRKTFCLGTFDTAEEAYNAYCLAADKYCGAFANKE